MVQHGPSVWVGILLMPASSLCAWVGLIQCMRSPGASPLAVLGLLAGFQFCWALKNRVAGPLRTDAGVVSFAPGMLTGVAQATGAVTDLSLLTAFGVSSCQ